MRELWLFVKALARDVAGKMCGVFGLAWTVFGLALPGEVSPWIFAALCLTALLIACFHVWRDAHREARPYDEETFKRARERFESLGEEEKAALECLVIEKSIAGSESAPNTERLVQAGFAWRDMASGRLALNHDYARIAPGLVKEWRARP